MREWALANPPVGRTIRAPFYEGPSQDGRISRTRREEDKRVHFTNDDDFRALSIDFDDGTALSFQMELDFSQSRVAHVERRQH